MPPAFSRFISRVRRAVRAHRRLLAAGCAAAAVAAAIHALSPAPPPTTEVLVASTDLPAGVTLRQEHVELVRLPGSATPSGALSSPAAVTGRLLAGPVRAGEPLTDVRLLGPALIEGYGGGRVAAPVRIADAEAVRLLRPGDRIDVMAADPQGRVETALVAPDTPVIVVPRGGGGTNQDSSGAIVVLAVSPDTASRLAKASVSGPISFTLRG
jgi:Flp pilus assembly protein CpaB